MNDTKSVLVGMSGGVDSAVAALLLLREGWRVEGVTLCLWGDSPGSDDAYRVCRSLGIRHTLLDGREAFRSRVVDYFAGEYIAGHTPNPCVICNSLVKFPLIAELARKRGIDYIATGHYARVSRDSQNGRSLLLRASNLPKDQSYVLYSLSQDILKTLLLPLGDYSKDEIRGLALKAGLDVSQKADSQDICFVPDGDYAGFLRNICPGQTKSGSFIDKSGRVLGEHRGLWHYTIGQRRGLGISFGKPMFVGALDASAGTVTLVEEAQLYQSALEVKSLNWIDRDCLYAPARLEAKIRYSAAPVPVLVTPLSEGRALVEFERPQRAMTLGQHAVFYQGEVLAGGGVIAGVLKNG